MPPLRYNPDITLAQTQPELDERFRAFMEGRVAYVRAHDDGRAYELFMPPDLDHHEPVFGLMMDGITWQPVSAEYFGDYATYLEVTDGAKPRIASELADGGVRKRGAAAFIQKILRKQ